MSPQKSKTSSVWNYFREKSNTIAVCNMCKQELSYKSTTNNLRKHLQRKHPTVNLRELVSCNQNDANTICRDLTSGISISQNSNCAADLEAPSTSKETIQENSQLTLVISSKKATIQQSHMGDFLRRKMGISTKKKLMIV